MSIDQRGDHQNKLMFGTLAITLVAIVIIFSLVLSESKFQQNIQKLSTNNTPPPRNGSIRTWSADNHWWVVGDGWGVHHPDCPCKITNKIKIRIINKKLTDSTTTRR
jgi:hypothetical protein